MIVRTFGGYTSALPIDLRTGGVSLTVAHVFFFSVASLSFEISKESFGEKLESVKYQVKKMTCIRWRFQLIKELKQSRFP